MTYTRATLAAHLAGALDPDQSAEIATMAAIDPALAKRLDRLQTFLDADEPRPRGRPPKDRTERLHVRVSPPVREWVRSAAQAAGQSEADVIEALVRDRMDLSGTPAPAGQEPDRT